MLPGDDLQIHDKQGVILLSGGIDSCVNLALLLANHWRLTPLFLHYGQRHDAEEFSAYEIVKHYKRLDGPHWRLSEVVRIAMPSFPSPLTHTEEMPKPRTLEELRADPGESPWFVPGRNGMFLSVAVAYAQTYDYSAVFIGATAEDVIGFADCRPKYFEHWEELATLQGPPVRVRSILAQSRKEDVIRIGLDLNAPLHLTTTCYFAGKRSNGCGRCDACMIRREAFENLDRDDPCEYP